MSPNAHRWLVQAYAFPDQLQILIAAQIAFVHDAPIL